MDAEIKRPLTVYHVDLFSGIGGFALAADAVFGNVRHLFCEWDPFCTAVLKKHWPEAEYWGDIAELVAHTSSNRRTRGGQATEIEEGYKAESQHSRELEGGFERPHSPFADTRSKKSRGLPGSQRQAMAETGKGSITILTGGFPCQPFSQAGRRNGTADDRYKWPEMFAIIRNTKPDWVIAENVAGLVTWSEGMVLEQVCSDLEAEDYEVQPLIIPAVSVNAPHRRDRIWIIANRRQEHGGEGNNEGMETDKAERTTCTTDLERQDKNAHHALYTGLEGHTDTDKGQEKRQGEIRPNAPAGWESDWPSVATRLCTLDDGLPAGLVRPRGWRNAALKAAGNAIVPQVAMQIFQAIKLTQTP